MLSQNLSSSVDKTIQTENLNDSSQETLWTEISIQKVNNSTSNNLVNVTK